MKLTRPSRIVAAFIVLISMLFMQLAVAAYACSDLEAANFEAAMEEVHADAMEADADCVGSDREQVNLCNAHATSGNQSLNTPNVAPAAPFNVAALTVVLGDTEPSYTPLVRNLDAPPLRRVTAPPLAIQHCCFRI